MNFRVPSRHRGVACLSILLLNILLHPGFALAHKDVHLSTQGDPGDGTLSPITKVDSLDASPVPTSDPDLVLTLEARFWILGPGLMLPVGPQGRWLAAGLDHPFAMGQRPDWSWARLLPAAMRRGWDHAR